MSSLIKKPRLHGSGRRLFRSLSRSGGFSSVVGRRLRRRLPVPIPKKRFLPFHLGLPCGFAVVLGSDRFEGHYYPALPPYIWIAQLHSKAALPDRMLEKL